jgi:hypothetical protein
VWEWMVAYLVGCVCVCVCVCVLEGGVWLASCGWVGIDWLIDSMHATGEAAHLVIN